MTLRVLLLADPGGRRSSLEPDPLTAALRAHAEVALDESDLTDAREVDDLLSRTEADVWITTSADSLARAGRGARARAARGRPTRVVHDGARMLGDGTSYVEQQPGLLGLADAVVVPTVAAATWLRRAGTAVPEVVVVRPWLPGGPRPASSLDERRIVLPGPLVRDRRPGQAVKAFARVAGEAPGWQLRLLGAGPLRREVTLQAKRDGVAAQTEIVTDPEPGPEWSRAAAALLVARVEPFPLDGLAAMAAGVPVVATDVPGGVAELVEHDVNGLLVAPGSISGIARAMLRLTRDEALRARLGQGALRTAEAHDAPTSLDRWLRVLRGGPAPDPIGGPTGETCPVVATRTDLAPASEPLSQPGSPAPTTGRRPPTPQEARVEALRLVTRAAEATGSPWTVLPVDPPTVVLADTARDDLLEALGSGAAPSYLSLRVPAQSAWPERRLALGSAVSAGRGLPATLVVEPWPLEADGEGTLAGQGCGVEVQLWSDDDGRLLPPSPNGLLEAVDPVDTPRHRIVQGLEVPVPEELAARGVHDHDFDVDVVVTWVDGLDPAWREQRDRRLGEAGSPAHDRTASGRARYEDHGELRYCLRSVWCFAPWVRRIHLVTAGQVPSWLDTRDDRVRVVDHTEILPADALPTFSSRAIETRLHHIPDLAEHFVYLNDDVLLGRPQRPDRFFTPAGAPRVFLSSQPIGTPGPDRPAYLAAAANNRRLLEEAFGVRITQTLGHTGHGHTRTLLAEVEELFADAVAATTRSPFRSASDVSMVSSLAQHHGLITGRAVVGDAARAFIGLGSADLQRQTRAALHRDQDFVCLADQHDYALAPQRVDRVVADFLERYLPRAAPWEVDTEEPGGTDTG